MFKSEDIEQHTKDDLSDQVKGTTVWKSDQETEGYYAFSFGKYIPIEYLKDRHIWCEIDYDYNCHTWYTVRPAPLEYGLGPYRHNFSGIDVDSDTEQPASKPSEPSEPSHDTPTQSTLNINVLTAPMSTLTFAPTFTVPVLPGDGSRGGGGGGGGGGRGPQLHPLRLHPVPGLQEEEEVAVEVADHPLPHLLHHLLHQQQPQILQMTS